MRVTATPTFYFITNLALLWPNLTKNRPTLPAPAPRPHPHHLRTLTTLTNNEILPDFRHEIIYLMANPPPVNRVVAPWAAVACCLA